MPGRNELWRTWLEAHLWIEQPGDSWWHLSPRADGVVGEFPLATPVYLVTAYNPRGEELTLEDNERHQQKLLRYLEEQAVAMLRAVGASKDGSWSEPGYALLDVSETEALAIARRFEQAALYAWTEQRLEVVGALQQGRASVGWALDAAPPPRS